jgi:hypothetical protein
VGVRTHFLQRRISIFPGLLTSKYSEDRNLPFIKFELQASVITVTSISIFYDEFTSEHLPGFCTLAITNNAVYKRAKMAFHMLLISLALCIHLLREGTMSQHHTKELK